MKKLMGGLRRNRNSIGSSSTTDEGKNITPQEPPTDNDDVNYADLFDNDDDENENSKENNLNRNISQKQRAKKKTSSTTSHKKRKKLNPQKQAAVASMKVMPMMTISEVLDCEESTEDEKEGEGMSGGGDGHLVNEDGDLNEEAFESEELNNERNEGEDVDLSGGYTEDDGEVLHGNSVVEEFKTEDENKVDPTITTSQEVLVVEEEQETIDVNTDDKEIASSINGDIEKSHVSEEVLNEEDAKSPEAVTQQFSHDNVIQSSNHYETNINIRDDTCDYWSRMGLYSPSSFMQSLRIKYQVGLEGHA